MFINDIRMVSIIFSDVLDIILSQAAPYMDNLQATNPSIKVMLSKFSRQIQKLALVF